MDNNKKYINERGTEIYGYVLNSKLMAAAYVDKRLQNETRSTLGLLISYAYDDGFIIHFSVKRTARNRNVERWAIYNQINKLIKLGYIQKEKTGGYGATSHYRLLYDNFEWFEGVTPLDNTPSVTPLDNTGVTSRDYTDVTPSGYIKKTLENKEIKKEINVRVHGDFLGLVKEEIEEHSFQEIGNLSEEIIHTQATACWEAWDSENNFPKGNPISKFKGWVRKGLREGSIKETSSNLKNRNALQGVHVAEPENPIQDWHKQIRRIVGDDIYKSWFRPCWYDEKLYAPTKFSAERIAERYRHEINQVLPNVSISHQPYKGGLHEVPL